MCKMHEKKTLSYENLRRPVCLLLGCILIAAAGVLAWHNTSLGKEAGTRTGAIATALSAKMADLRFLPEDYPEEITPDWVLDPDRDMPTVEIDGIACIGTLSFPERNIEFPVASDWDYPTLDKAACRYWGSVYKDDAILFGHNYEGQLKFLPDLEPEEKVVFTDIDGNEFTYEMAGGATLWPRQVKELCSKNDMDWDLTVFTCTTWGEARVVVRFIRIDPEKTDMP